MSLYKAASLEHSNQLILNVSSQSTSRRASDSAAVHKKEKNPRTVEIHSSSMKLIVSITLLFALSLVGQEAETFELSSILPWNWSMFHKASGNSTAPSAAPKETEKGSPDAQKNQTQTPVKDTAETKAKDEPMPPPPTTNAPEKKPEDAKVKRDLIYEYDGYD